MTTTPATMPVQDATGVARAAGPIDAGSGRSAPRVSAHRLLLVLVVIAICTVPAVMVSHLGLQDPFSWRVVAHVDVQGPHLFPVDRTDEFWRHWAGDEARKAQEVILRVLSGVSGLSAVHTVFVPLGALLVPLTLFVLARRLLGSVAIAALVAFFASLEIGVARGSYSVLMAAFATPLTFMFALLLVAMLRRRRPALLVLAFLLFLAVTFYYYNPAMVLLGFVFVLNAALLVRWLVQGRKRELLAGTTVDLLIAMIIAFFTFSPAFDIGIRQIDPASLLHVFEYFVETRLAALIGLREVPVEPYAFVSADRFWYLITMLTVVSIMCVPAWTLLADLFSFVARRRWRNITERHVVRWAFIGSVLIVGLLYNIVGIVGVPLLAGPWAYFFVTIAAVYLFRESRWRLRWRGVVITLTVPLLLGLLALQVTRFYSYHKTEGIDQLSLMTHERARPSAGWFLDHRAEGGVILADFYLLQLYHYYAAGRGDMLTDSYQKWFDWQRYRTVIDPGFALDLPPWYQEGTGDIGHYVVIDVYSSEEGRAVLGQNWKYFEPFSLHDEEIERNYTLDKLYDDGSVWIFMRNRRVPGPPVIS